MIFLSVSFFFSYPPSFTISEQAGRIHVLERADPLVIDEISNTPIKQEDLLVKIYLRANDQEVKDITTIRYS